MAPRMGGPEPIFGKPGLPIGGRTTGVFYTIWSISMLIWTTPATQGVDTPNSEMVYERELYTLDT